MTSDDPANPESIERERQVGLCFRCRNARVVPARHAQYWMCRLSRVDPRFPKYPRLPVLACAGFTPGARDEEP